MGGSKFTDRLLSQETKTVRGSIASAFDEDNGKLCFNTLNNADEEYKKKFPAELLPSATETFQAFNQRIKRKRADECFSSPLDWRSPQRFPQYQLVEKPLISYKIELLNEHDKSQKKDDSVIYYKIKDNDLTIYASNGQKNPQGQFVYDFKNIDISSISSLAGFNPVTQEALNQALPEILSITTKRQLTRQYLPDQDYLCLNLDEHDAKSNLSYWIKNPRGEIVKGQIEIGNCVLINLGNTNIIDSNSEYIKQLTPFQQALIRTSDGKLHWLERPSEEAILVNQQDNTKEQFDALCEVFQKTSGLQPTTKEQRKNISAILSRVNDKPIVFEIDKVTEGLASRHKNQDDGKLDDVISRIQTETLRGTADVAVEHFNRSPLVEATSGFFNTLAIHGEGHRDISSVLSNEELFRYSMVYETLPKNGHEGDKHKKAFEKEMRAKLIQDTNASLKQLLDQNPPAYPKETHALVSAMMKKINENDRDDHRIFELRTLQQFLSTSWAKGQALTDDVATLPRDEAELTIDPFVKKRVEEALPLALDKNSMPNFAAYAVIFESPKFKNAIRQYNAKVEISHAHAAIKTNFYIPKDEKEWADIKKNKRNCFVLYNYQLYHINSDKTQTRLPIDLARLLPLAENFAQQKLAEKFEVKPAPLSSEDKRKLQTNGKIYLVHDERANTYTIAYGEGNKVQEQALNDLLGEHVPYDPNLTLAKETLARAVRGTTIFDYWQSVLGQMPQSGKYFSMVHRGKLVGKTDYVFAKMPNNFSMKKGEIYIENQNGGYVYSIIDPKGNKIWRQPIKTPISDLNQLYADDNKELKKQLITEIADQGHAYKPDFSAMLGADPDTMMYKLNTKVGYAQSMQKYRHAREKRRVAWKNFSEDQGTWGLTDARLEAVRDAARMAKGELTTNHHLMKRQCGLAEYMTKSAKDSLVGDTEFMKHLKSSQDKDQDMYYLHVQQNGNQSTPVGLYYVDFSGAEPVVTKVEPKETASEIAERLAQQNDPNGARLTKMSGIFNSAKVKQEQDEFYQNLHKVLDAVGAPESVKNHNTWTDLGLKNAQPGAEVLYKKFTKSDENSAEFNDNLTHIFDEVSSRDAVYLVEYDDKYQLVYRDWSGKPCEEVFEDKAKPENGGLVSLAKNLSSGQPLRNDIRKTLNEFLHNKGSSSQLPQRQRKIPVISAELDEAINAETKEVRQNVTAYDDQLDAYAHNEINNQLSAVLAARQELLRRSQEEEEKLKTYIEQLTAMGIDFVNQGEDLYDINSVQGNKKISYDALKKKLIVYEYNINIYDEKEVNVNKNDIEQILNLSGQLKDPDVAQLNREILAEQYQIQDLDPDEYKALSQWMGNDQQGKPPIALDRNKFYIHRYFDSESKFICLGLDHFGKLKSTAPCDQQGILYDAESNHLTEQHILMTLLPITEDAGISLPGKLVNEDFLNRCQEAQQFLDKLGHQAQDRMVSPGSILPQEKREKLLRMMTEIAMDPTSKKAAHYLLGSHKMYICDRVPEKPDEEDKMPPSFYMVVSSDMQNPQLYRFLTDEDGYYIKDNKGQYTCVQVNLQRYVTGTPEEALLKIAQAQSAGFRIGGEVTLSSQEVYYHITNQSNEALKMDTAMEMIEEIYQQEVGTAKILEKTAISLTAAGTGLGMLSMGNPGFLPAVLAPILLGIKSLIAGACFLASLTTARSAVVKNAWFDGGLSELKEKISKLKALETYAVSIENPTDDHENEFVGVVESTVPSASADDHNPTTGP